MADVQAADLDRAGFIANFLRPREPVIVRGALMDWPKAPPWSFDDLVRELGPKRVPLFDTLFSLRGLSSFSGFVAEHIDQGPRDDPPYLRWFHRQSTERFPWADEAFAQLQDWWHPPAWLPDKDYIFPAGSDDVATSSFPAKGLFICGSGARTRLHKDPWTSDACLCQVTGRKRLTLWQPEAEALFVRGDHVIDLAKPEHDRFPEFEMPPPALSVTLAPGDAAYIPAQWYHTAVALEDSISVTWNFVHRSHASEFEEYLDSGGDVDETVRYFLEDSLTV